ncbi:glycosyltransferase family 4 protein [Methylobacterium planeticum]|uniref:Glycosyltransferase family 4 protein n=1 Tax=Methylobacterium planeticum TaxID=2615211 RepID=A0A6N6MKT7_9HYPH|nr:glycosyltransferase family 4 protein [Methylobacterium planeticum]KAB1070306.1 glycosyltransferase family 4 protein [Methylobacterium planeticum]
MTASARSNGAARIGIVVKGYPRLSETFIAQEILALERRGLALEIWALRRPTDALRHPMHAAVRAPVAYLPEYLHQAPWRGLKALAWAMRQPGLRRLLSVFWRDLRRDPTANRGRRLGQALILARELPDAVGHLHAHFLHTPASVTRYAALLTGRSWSFSAHAKDIWTTPDWELTEKMAAASWGVTCTRDGLARLEACGGAGTVTLAYHGLDLGRFPAPASRAPRDGARETEPFRILTVGRLVAKKGFDDLIAALAGLPPSLHWRASLIGGGELRAELTAQVRAAGLSERVTFLGARAQPDVIAAMREADLFVLPTKRAPTGDRDGLPNVLMEAASQGLPILATDFAGTPELIRNGTDGLLVPPGDVSALAAAITRLAGDPEERARLARSAYARLTQDFTVDRGIDVMAARFGQAGPGVAAPALHEPGAACACGS